MVNVSDQRKSQHHERSVRKMVTQKQETGMKRGNTFVNKYGNAYIEKKKDIERNIVKNSTRRSMNSNNLKY